jgi:hypothetical protein
MDIAALVLMIVALLAFAPVRPLAWFEPAWGFVFLTLALIAQYTTVIDQWQQNW